MGDSLATDYWLAFWRRRWPILSVTFLVIAVASLVLAVLAYSNRPWVASTQLFVAVKPVPGASEGSAVGFEAESRQITIDFSQIIGGRTFATAVAGLSEAGLQPSTVQSDLAGIADNRILTITASTSSARTSLALDRAAEGELAINRSRFVGPFVAGRTTVTLVSPPVATRQAGGHILLALLIRLALAVIVALALALGWDYLVNTSRANPA